MNRPTTLRNRHERRKTRVSVAADAPSNLHRLPNVLGQAAMLEWLGQTPISFHRAYVELTGGVVPALWLSHAMSRVTSARAHEFEPDGDFVFSMTAIECEAATGISRAQQLTCRRALAAAGLLSERSVKRQPTVFRLHLDAIARKLLAQSAPLAETLSTYEPLPELPSSWARQA